MERSSSLDARFVFSFDAAEREGVELVRGAQEQLGGGVISWTEPAINPDDEVEDTFVDVVGDGQSDEGAESEGFTFTDALMRANLLSESPLEGVVSSSEPPVS